jgi:hypothetical protein
MRFRRNSGQGPPQQPTAATPDEYFRLGALRLYQPDSTLQERFPGGVADLAAYCKTLTWVGTEYFDRLGQEFGSMGILIAVGIKPGKRIRLWCEQVDGDITTDVWQVLVELLEGAGQNVLPVTSGPVACALECLLGAGPSSGFPVVPSIWQEAGRSAAKRLVIPDDLFEIVFPDQL